MIYNCFYVTLSTLIEPSNYQKEFQRAKKILEILEKIYPEIEKKELQEYLLDSYAVHDDNLSLFGRIEFVKALIFLTGYEQKRKHSIVDPYGEYKNRLLEYRKQYQKNPSKQFKMAIIEITDYQYLDQIQFEKTMMLFPSISSYLH